MEDEAARLKPKHLISIVDPDVHVATPESVDAADHWRFNFHDISDPISGQVPPEKSDIVRLLEFGDAWDGAKHTLIHCHAGISRSHRVEQALQQRHPEHANRAVLLCCVDPDVHAFRPRSPREGGSYTAARRLWFNPLVASIRSGRRC